MNHIPVKIRLKELLVDYLVIIAYLALLLIVNLMIMFFNSKGNSGVYRDTIATNCHIYIRNPNHPYFFVLGF